MILDKEIEINVKSSKIIFLLKKINIPSKIGDSVIIPIEKLWSGSNIKINVECDICGKTKKLNYNLYNKNIGVYNLYCCSSKCANIKNKKTCLSKYGLEKYVNVDKMKQTKFEKYGNENYVNVDKIKQTKLEKYGDENYNNKEKIVETNLQKYGKENTFQVKEFQDKSKLTNLQKYGIEDSRSSELIINKRKKTIFDKFGKEFYTQTQEYKDKVKETSMKKYGVDSPNKSEKTKIKKMESMLNKYGFISNSMTIECKEKLRKTNLERYGVEYPMQVAEFALKQQKNSKKIEYFNNDLYYQGSYERDFLIYMDNLNMLHLIKRSNMIKYEFNYENKIYYPDFFIEKFNLNNINKI